MVNPREKISEDTVYGLPLCRSGAMYRRHPTLLVIAVRSALRKPLTLKSDSFIWPRLFSKMLPGAMSANEKKGFDHNKEK